MASLTLESRYARLAETAWIGAAGLSKIQRSTIAVLGVGNVGRQVVEHWALMGSPLILVDRDHVAVENLGTQGFSQEKDVGLSKVEARARGLVALNSSCRVQTVAADVEAIGMGLLRNADLIYCCLDNRKGRVVINEIATRLGIPWLDTAVDGSGTMMLGRVAAYDTLSAGSACYTCPLDGESLLEIATEGTPPGCPSLDSGTAQNPPTLAISALGGVVAGSAVVTGLKMLLGKTTDVVSREAYLDLDRMDLETHTLKRNPRCVSDHRAFALTPLDGVRTVGETYAIATERLGNEPLLQLQRRSLVRRLRCPDCVRERETARVLESMTRRERTCKCGAPMKPLAGYVTDRLTHDDAHQLRRRTWKELGLPAEDVVVASRGSAEIAFLLP